MPIRKQAALALLLLGAPGLAAAQDGAPAIPDPPAQELASPSRARQTQSLTYFLYIENKQWGPYTVAQLRDMAADKNFYQDDLVWKEGAAEWKRAQNYPELAAFALANDQPPTPEFKPAEPEQALEAAVEPDQAGRQEAGPDQQVAAAEPTTPDAAAPDAGPDAGPDGPPPPPDAVKKPEPATLYYVSVAGAATGPYSLDDLKKKVADGEISATSYLWWKGAAWTQADKVAELSSSFAAKPTTPPFDCEGFMTGVWERNSYYSSHLVSLRVRYDTGGRYSGSQAMAGMPGSTFYGSWTTTAVGEKACSLTLNQQYPDVSQRTFVLDIVDEDTVKDQSDEGIARRL
ncbi:MAG: DUF4339 domain-containing protein [Mesorhizobium sp.]|nr:DUF4339 domain-containing protein [Mesorhizobium sp.]